MSDVMTERKHIIVYNLKLFSPQPLLYLIWTRILVFICLDHMIIQYLYRHSWNGYWTNCRSCKKDNSTSCKIFYVCSPCYALGLRFIIKLFMRFPTKTNPNYLYLRYSSIMMLIVMPMNFIFRYNELGNQMNEICNTLIYISWKLKGCVIWLSRWRNDHY